MPESQNIEYVLGQAKEQEKRYEWLEAVDFYNKALSSALDSKDFFKAGEISGQIGFCYRRAAYQAENSDNFKDHLRLAVEFYNKASELFEKAEVSENGKLVKSNHFKALGLYANFELTADLSERKMLLDKVRGMMKAVLKAYEEAGDRIGYGKACSDLLECLSDRITLEADWQESKRIHGEGINHGEKAIAMLSETGDDKELARAYLMVALHYSFAAGYNELKEQWKELVERGLTYSKKALELSEKVGDAYLIGMSSLGLIMSAVPLGDFVQAMTYGNLLVRQSAKTKDNLLLGWASLGMAQMMDAMMTMEENPDKIREGYGNTIRYAEDALRYFSIIYSHTFAAQACSSISESYIHLTREVETGIEQKNALLEKAVEFGRNGLQHAEKSGPSDVSMSLHTLSKGLYFLSALKPNLEEKKRVLEEASRLRERNINLAEETFAPFDYWDRGVFQNYLALIRAKQAELEIDRDKKRELLEKAVSGMENCLKLCKKGLTEQPQVKVGDVPFSLIPFGWYQGWFGDILERLYSLTGEEGILEKAIDAYKGVIETYTKVGFSSRVAEAHWKISKLYDLLGNYQESAEHFDSATKHYEASAEGMPNLKEFYMDYASYMQAWVEIERARFSNAREEYAEAQKHYDKAASLLESSKMWKYLSPNYAAWALLEQAEDQSRKEQSEEAMETFKKAAQLFGKAKSSLEGTASKTQSPEEKDMVLTTIKASQIRSEYCTGRMTLEEAKILDREGDHLSSAQKYLAAAHIFEKLSKQTESEKEQKELKPIVWLCQAWQKMTLADARASPELYLEASQLFEQISEQSGNERTRLLALGHSRFCKALEVGTRFTDTRDTALHSAAIKHLQSATSYYEKAGLQNVAEYANATGLLFDACVNMDNAKKEMDPEKKARLYMMTEKILETSAGAYLKAKQPAKMREVQKLLTKIRKERELAVSLTEILRATPIVSITPAFSTPVKDEEKAVGLERFEHANIQATLILRVKEVKIGEDIDLEIELVNAGKRPALLVKVEEIIPKGFEIKQAPEIYRVENCYLNMKGKKLDPLKTEEVKMVVKPFSKGTFILKPRILYLDETGEYKSHEPEPVTINVKELGISGWLKGER